VGECDGFVFTPPVPEGQLPAFCAQEVACGLCLHSGDFAPNIPLNFMSEFTSFLLNFQHRPIVVLACLIAVVLCFALRRSPWIITLWLPSFVLTGAYTCVLLLQFLRGIGGHGADAGWFVFAGMMEAVVGFPIVISAVLLLVCRPVKSAWRPRYLIPASVPVAIVPIALAFWSTNSKPIMNFTVTDESGQPLQGVAVRDMFNSPPRFTTDHTGTFHDRLPHRDIFGCCFTVQGYLEHHVTVYRGGAHAETYYVDHSWIDRGSGRINVTESKRIEYPARQSTIIPVIMRTSVQNASPNSGPATPAIDSGVTEGRHR
jgi:hypothetical protein